MIETNNINLNLFKYFIIAAESKSLSQAGEKLGYSESTISTNISTLEKQLGAKLLTRKPLKMTEVGEEIYEIVKKGFSDFDFAMIIAKSNNNLEYGRLSIGCNTHITEAFLMERMVKATADYPNMQINLDTRIDRRGLVTKLKNNEIDFAITDSDLKDYVEELEIEELKTLDCIFVSKEPTNINNIEELGKYKYILPHTKDIANIRLTELLKEHNIEFDIILKCSSTETRILAAKSGMGIAYVLKDVAQKALDNKEVYEVKIPEKLAQKKLQIAYLKNHLTKVDKEFIKKYII